MSNGVNEHLNVALQKQNTFMYQKDIYACSLRFKILNLNLFLNTIYLHDILNPKLQVK